MNPIATRREKDFFAGICLLAAVALLAGGSAFLTGCSKGGKGAATSPTRTVADLSALKQDCRAYLGADRDTPLVSAEVGKQMVAGFVKGYMRPWTKQGPEHAAAEVRLAFGRFAASPGFAQNGRVHPKEYPSQLLQLAGLEKYPNCRRAAITTRNVNLREVPTWRPRFDDFYAAGSNYPFDTLQVTALWANTPVYVCHVSSDGAWAYVESAAASGWMNVGDLAYVDEPFIRAWGQHPLAALTADNVPFVDAGGVFRFRTHLGAVFPMVSESAEGIEVLVAVGQEGNRAAAVSVRLGRGCAAAMPMAMTPANLARLANVMMGQPYGWGGMYEDRDCSATLRDLYTPFGLLLPRNSGEQALAGQVTALGSLGGPAKERMILERGVPWMTFLNAPGHIVLYLGKTGGKAIVLQNAWGVKTRGADGTLGRLVIGQCCITTLQPGIELTDIALPDGDLRYRIGSMTLINPLVAAKP